MKIKVGDKLPSSELFYLDKNNNLNLTTDKILIDMKTGDVKLEMINNYEKVKLVANYELIN